MDFLESMQSRFDRKISLFSVGYARNLISSPLFVQSLFSVTTTTVWNKSWQIHNHCVLKKKRFDCMPRLFSGTTMLP